MAIAEFDDAGIRRLLANWPKLDAAEADRFFAGLADSPQLMRLAGSPLLLTMMVYLHTEVFVKTGRTLPSSRPAFYEIAVDHLLRRDRELARDDALFDLRRCRQTRRICNGSHLHCSRHHRISLTAARSTVSS